MFVVVDDVAYFAQEGFYILGGWFDNQLAVILADVLPQKIEPVVNVGYDRFLRGQFQSALCQKLCDDWFDFLFQQFFGCAGDDEVIGLSDQIDFGFASGSACRSKLISQSLFQPIQSEVCQRR